MSLRMIAKDLYRLQREVEKLEERLNSAPMDKRAELKDQLRKIKAERDKMRKILEGTKEPPHYRLPR